VEFLHEKYTASKEKVKNMVQTKVQKSFWKAGNDVCLIILVNFNAAGSGSAFTIRSSESRICIFPIRNPWVWKAPDPGFGSATLDGSSVADPWHFGVYADPDPRINASD
jgi:hypothetical protein